MARLRRSNPAVPGLRRVADGHGGDRYTDARGEGVTDPETLTRIAELVIPPAWNEVWISPDPDGHIQATGTDAAGRRQYLYHPQWRARRDLAKFDRILDFAAALPAARRAVSRDLGGDGFRRPRALAAAFRLLDDTGVRVGSPRYLRSAGTRGLTTLLCRHVDVAPPAIALEFLAKGGVRFGVSFDDEALARYVREVVAARSARAKLLVWREGRGWRALSATDVNDYVRARTVPAATAKDFRTLRGTIVAARELARHGPEQTRKAQASVIRESVQRAAEALGNTPAVARTSYIDPRVVQAYREGRTALLTRGRVSERALIDLLG